MSQRYEGEIVNNPKEELDNRQIADMNIEGMPWYRPKITNPNMVNLTKKEARAVVRGALKAGLLVGGIFWLAFFGLILFCVLIWFR